MNINNTKQKPNLILKLKNNNIGQDLRYDNQFNKTKPRNPDYYVCYLITKESKFTYVGITNNLLRRIRQHNGEIKGGAKYTTSKNFGNTEKWEILLTVSGFASYIEVLRFEWHWKYFSKKYRKLNIRCPIKSRLQALNELLKSKIRKPISVQNLNLNWYRNTEMESYYKSL